MCRGIGLGVNADELYFYRTDSPFNKGAIVQSSMLVHSIVVITVQQRFQYVTPVLAYIGTQWL